MANKEKTMAIAREERALLARAAGLLKVLDDLEVPLDLLTDDNAALTLIEAVQLKVMLDPETRNATKLKAASDLARVRGLDKQSRIAEDERRIRKIRDGLAKVEERVVDGEFTPEDGPLMAEIPENSTPDKERR